MTSRPPYGQRPGHYQNFFSDSERFAIEAALKQHICIRSNRVREEALPVRYASLLSLVHHHWINVQPKQKSAKLLDSLDWPAHRDSIVRGPHKLIESLPKA